MTSAPTLGFERELLADGRTWLVGMDEVGRGAFGGPVSVGVCLIDADVPVPPVKLRDSKLLSATAREKLLPDLEQWASALTVGDATAAEIDQFGIVGALRLAGMRALAQLPTQPDIVLLDEIG